MFWNRKRSTVLDLKAATLVSTVNGITIAVAFSGGPDAAALAARLVSLGSNVIPVYVRYRNKGGKTTKDLQAALRCAQKLGLSIELVESPLVKPISADEKSHRNRIILKTISEALADRVQAVAIGTFKELCDPSGQWTGESNDDLDPENLVKELDSKHDLITWDSFGVTKKADQFRNLSPDARAAIFATVSCQMWWKVECGNCYSCVERFQAFIDAFGEDPTTYRQNSTVGKRIAARLGAS